MKPTTATLFDVLQAPEAKGLRAADKLVLLYLAWRQGSHGQSWPSLQTIEQDLRINRKTRRRAIEHLCQVGCIRKTSGRCGRGHPNRYEIVVAEKGGACIPISSPEKGPTCIPISEEERERGREEEHPYNPLKGKVFLDKAIGAVNYWA